MPETQIWTPLVHGRTYEADYRSNLLAVPDGFTSADLDWAMPFIQGTFDNFLVKGVPEPVHWSVFKNNRYCVVGLTCLAHQVSEDMNRDVGNRVLPVFLGYVCQEVIKPVLPRMEIGEKGSQDKPGGQFSELYRYARERWREKRQSNSMRPVKDVFELEIASYLPPSQNILNVRKGWTYVYPVLEKMDKTLWAAASHYQGPFSLCLGLSRQSTAISGPFLNATAYDITDPVGAPKPLKTPPAAPNPQPSETHRQTSSRSRTTPQGHASDDQTYSNKEHISQDGYSTGYRPRSNLIGRFFQHISYEIQDIFHPTEETEEVFSSQEEGGPSSYPQTGYPPPGGKGKKDSSHAPTERYPWGTSGNNPKASTGQPQSAPPARPDWFNTKNATSNAADREAKKDSGEKKQTKRNWFGEVASSQTEKAASENIQSNEEPPTLAGQQTQSTETSAPQSDEDSGPGADK